MTIKLAVLQSNLQSNLCSQKSINSNFDVTNKTQGCRFVSFMIVTYDITILSIYLPILRDYFSSTFSTYKYQIYTIQFV